MQGRLRWKSSLWGSVKRRGVWNDEKVFEDYSDFDGFFTNAPLNCDFRHLPSSYTNLQRIVVSMVAVANPHITVPPVAATLLFDLPP
jgi:hypothetical protein